jgi:hypothetical protein
MYSLSNVSIWYDKPWLVYKHIRSTYPPFIHTRTKPSKIFNLSISKCAHWEIPAYSASSMFQEIYKIWDPHMFNLYKMLISKSYLSLSLPVTDNWVLFIFWRFISSATSVSIVTTHNFLSAWLSYKWNHPEFTTNFTVLACHVSLCAIRFVRVYRYFK